MFRSFKNVFFVAGLLLFTESQCVDRAENELEHTKAVGESEKSEEKSKEKEIYNDILAVNSNSEEEEGLETAELEAESKALSEVFGEPETTSRIIADVCAPSYDKLIPIKGGTDTQAIPQDL